MAVFELFGLNAMEIIVLIYFVIGSYSLGYLLLRTGWPRIRILDENYRIGWSIIFGVVFSGFWLALAFGFGMQRLFPIILTITMIIVIIVLSLRRKLIASENITVAVPKEKAAVQVVADKSIERFLADKEFILTKNLSQQQVEKIKQSLQKEEEVEKP